jgi:hypothetical protein
MIDMTARTTDTLTMTYEFFSWKGFAVGAAFIAAILAIQSMIGFPAVWNQRALDFVLLIVVSSLMVGSASGGVLIYLIPPDQDVIGVAGLGSDDLSQHISLLLVILALIQPMMSGFVFFYEYFGADPVSFIWVLLGFAAPSMGFAIAMLDRQRAIADDLMLYFSQHDKLDLVTLDWLHGHGTRTAVYRMGMLESAASKVKGLKVVGHEMVVDKKQSALTQ